MYGTPNISRPATAGTNSLRLSLHVLAGVRSLFVPRESVASNLQWNVRTRIDREGANRPERRTALVAMELAKYNIDIAALCETRFSGSGSLDDLEYSFFWSGKPEGERREAGVGFAIKKDIVTKLTEMPRPVSYRIMMMRLPLSKDNFATIISVYAPTMTDPDENKEAFYNQLASVLSDIPHTDKLLLIGDFNARIGRENDKWPFVMGKNGIGKCNSNGEYIKQMYSSTITITLECNHDYFHDYFSEYTVSNIKATFMESLDVILVLMLCH